MKAVPRKWFTMATLCQIQSSLEEYANTVAISLVHSIVANPRVIQWLLLKNSKAPAAKMQSLTSVLKRQAECGHRNHLPPSPSKRVDVTSSSLTQQCYILKWRQKTIGKLDLNKDNRLAELRTKGVCIYSTSG